MEMTGREFDVLDELYFVQSFKALADALNFKEEELLKILAGLFEKGWINCYNSPRDEIAKKEVDIKGAGRRYFYLATKEGLLQHNS